MFYEDVPITTTQRNIMEYKRAELTAIFELEINQLLIRHNSPYRA